MRAIGLLIGCAITFAACSQSAEPQPTPAAASPAAASAALTSPAVETASPTPFTAPSDASAPSPLPPEAASVPAEPTPGATAPPGTAPFPTPGPTITPGSTRVSGTVVQADGSLAQGICVVLEKGIGPIATDAQGVWFTDIPAGPINWNFSDTIDGAGGPTPVHRRLGGRGAPAAPLQASGIARPSDATS